MDYQPENQQPVNPPQGGPYPPVGGQPVYPPQQPMGVPTQNHGVNHAYGAPPQSYAHPQTFVQQATAIPQVDSSKKIPDRKSVASKMIELTYLVLIILESVLALRFIFRLLGANPLNPFIQFLYQATLVFTFPFTTLFSTPIQNTIAVQGYYLEFTTLVAMGVYALLAYIVVRVIDIFR